MRFADDEGADESLIVAQARVTALLALWVANSRGISRERVFGILRAEMEVSAATREIDELGPDGWPWDA